MAGQRARLGAGMGRRRVESVLRLAASLLPRLSRASVGAVGHHSARCAASARTGLTQAGSATASTATLQQLIPSAPAVARCTLPVATTVGFVIPGRSDWISRVYRGVVRAPWTSLRVRRAIRARLPSRRVLRSCSTSPRSPLQHATPTPTRTRTRTRPTPPPSPPPPPPPRSSLASSGHHRAPSGLKSPARSRSSTPAPPPPQHLLRRRSGTGRSRWRSPEPKLMPAATSSRCSSSRSLCGTAAVKSTRLRPPCRRSGSS